MLMLKSLFTPKWQSDEPTTRQRALAETSDPQIIATMAESDPLPALRDAALAKLADSALLKQLLEGANEPEKWLSIAFRLQVVEPQLETLVRRFKPLYRAWDRQTTFDILARQSQSDLAYQLLLATEDDDLPYEIAISNLSVDVRLAAVDDIETLDSLLRVLKKSSHKPVIQACRVKVEAIRAEQKKRQEIHTEASNVLAEMRQLADHTIADTFYPSKFERLERHWENLDLAALEVSVPGIATDVLTPKSSSAEIRNHADITEAFAQAREACQIKLAALQHAHALEAEKQQRLAQQSEICQQFEQLLGAAQQPTLSQAQLQQLEVDLQDRISAWLSCIELQDPTTANSARSIDLQKTIENQLAHWRRFYRLDEPLIALFDELPDRRYGAQQDWLKKWRRLDSSIDWPTDQPLPIVLAERRQQASAIVTAHGDVQSEERKKATTLRQKIVLLQRHCQNRDLAAATKLADYLAPKIAATHEDFGAGLQRKYDTALTQLAEVRDWHLFAITPKKEQLCSAMEGLCGDNLDALQRAAAIKDLQTEWQKLTASQSVDNDPLWDRFNAARKIAYQPCQAHYDEQNRIQTANYQRREDLIVEISNLLDTVVGNSPSPTTEQNVEKKTAAASVTGTEVETDTETEKKIETATETETEKKSESESESEKDHDKGNERAIEIDIAQNLPRSNASEAIARKKIAREAIDWKDLDQKLSKVQRDWQKSAPPSEKKRRKQQARFEAKNGKLHQLLLRTKQQNLQLRHELVGSAKKLVEHESLEHAIREARTLQQQWKTIGITFYKADREQWQLFRRTIDQLFSRRDKAQNERASGLREGADELIELTQKIEQLCKLPDSRLKASHSEFQQLSQSWDTSIELPRDSAKKLLQRFDQSREKYRKHFAGLSKRLQRDAHVALIRGAQMLSNAEVDYLNGSDGRIDADVLEPLREAINTLECSAQSRLLLDARVNQLSQSSSPQINQSGIAQLQQLALENEILLGIESPKDCSQERMRLQLERLKKGLGSATKNSNHRAMVLESFAIWVTIGGIPEAIRQPLEERREKIFKSVGL